MLLLTELCSETFGNLLLLYCKHHHYDLAADVLAENAELTFDLLTQASDLSLVASVDLYKTVVDMLPAVDC